jgi:Helix-turn-helix family
VSLNPGLARRMWHQLEPIHAVFYYAPEVFAEAAGLGYAVDTRWPSYFAWRAAPFGPAGPGLVAATFYSFSPAMVAEHVPAAWQVAPPGRVLQARLAAVDAMFRAQLGDRITDPRIAQAARLAREAAQAAPAAGRPLAAANADLPWPDEPHLVLWQAITILREHRGDGHVAALLTAGLDPCEALVSFAAVGAAPAETFASRGWTPGEWAAARDRLASRGWVGADGTATCKGRDGRDAIERRTDELASAPWRALGEDQAARLADLVAPVLEAALLTGLFPPNTTLGIGKIQDPVWT